MGNRSVSVMQHFRCFVETNPSGLRWRKPGWEIGLVVPAWHGAEEGKKMSAEYTHGHEEASDCRGQDRQELLRDMSDAHYELGSLYAREQARRDHDYRKAGRKDLIPAMVWKMHDIIGAGVSNTCLLAMVEQ